ncbi:MAG: hypothetical protein FJY56_04180 [Betaproteobacteria bacterium]|nr:hypothetical protein [Betaproteobacteria bacterium]
MKAPPSPPEDWSAPDAEGIASRALDVGAKSTLRARRLRRAPRPNAAIVAAWPAAWRDLLAAWLNGADKRRWSTLLAAAGNSGYAAAQALLAALLRAGLIETDETRERGEWRVTQVTFIERAALAAALGLPDTQALRAHFEQEHARPPQDERLHPPWDTLTELPPARALERLTLLRKLDLWLAEHRFGTRRDFALYARGATKTVREAEWRWLAAAPGFDAFGIEKQTPALWLRAPLTLGCGGKRLDLGAVPDVLGVSPATLQALDAIDGDIGCWRLVENRTSFERVAREHGARDGVLWLPGFAPSWWKDCAHRLLRFKPAAAHIACDPHPAGIQIALDAASVWQAHGLDWSPWHMEIADVLRLSARARLSSHDKVLIEQLLARELPQPLAALARWMQTHDAKGEQEGFL